MGHRHVAICNLPLKVVIIAIKFLTPKEVGDMERFQKCDRQAIDQPTKQVCSLAMVDDELLYIAETAH